VANGNIPYHRCHAQFINGVGCRAGTLQEFDPFSVSLNSFASSAKSVIAAKSASSVKSTIAAWGLLVQSVVWQ